MFSRMILVLLLLLYFSETNSSLANTGAKLTYVNLSEDGSQMVVMKKIMGNRLEVSFNNELIGIFDNINNIKNDEIKFGKNNFALNVITRDFKSALITRTGYFGPFMSISDKIEFVENGVIFVYARNDSLFIHTPEKEIATGQQATDIGDFVYDNGDYKIISKYKGILNSTTDQKHEEIYSDYRISSNNIVVKKNGEAAFAGRKERNYYISGFTDKIEGPYRDISMGIAYDADLDRTAIAVSNENDAYVYINSTKLGPFKKFEDASRVYFTGSDTKDFAYFYLRKEGIYIQKGEESFGPFVPKAMNGPMPVLSTNGERVMMYPSAGSGDFVQINNNIYGPYGFADKRFYKKILHDKYDLFKFKKHGNDFLFIEDKVYGPFEIVDYAFKGENGIILAYSQSEDTKIIKTSQDINDIQGLPITDKEKMLEFTAEIQDKKVKLELPFSWYSFNLFEKTNFFPMIMISPDETDFQAIFENIDKAKLPENTDKLIVISLQGGDAPKNEMKELMEKSIKFESEIEEIESIKDEQSGDLKYLTRTVLIKRENSPLFVKQFAFRKDNQWIMSRSFSQERGKDKFFEKTLELLKKLQLKL